MPEWSLRGAPGRPGGPLARPPSWPRRAPSWLPRTPPPTPPRLGTFLLLQKLLLYICPDRPGTVPRDFVCFLFRLFLPGKRLLIGDVFLWLDRRRLHGSSPTTTPARLQSKEVRRM